MIRATHFTLATGLFLGTAALAEITCDGAGGATLAMAVIMPGAEGSTDGVRAQFHWKGKTTPATQS